MKLQPINQQTNSMQNSKGKNICFNGIYRFVICQPDEVVDFSREYTMTKFSRIFQIIRKAFAENKAFVVNPPSEKLNKLGKKIHLQIQEDQFPPEQSRVLNVFSGEDADMYLYLKSQSSRRPKDLKSFFESAGNNDTFIVKNFIEAWSALEDILIQIKQNKNNAKVLEIFNKDLTLNWRKILAKSVLNSKDSKQMLGLRNPNLATIPSKEIVQDITKNQN